MFGIKIIITIYECTTGVKIHKIRVLRGLSTLNDQNIHGKGDFGVYRRTKKFCRKQRHLKHIRPCRK